MKKKVELIILLDKTGYKSNDTMIAYLNKYLANTEFKNLFIQKLISSKFDRDIACFRGDLFNQGYFSFDDLKGIVKELKTKNPLSALCLLIYCRKQIKELDNEYYTQNGEELFATTKAIVYDFQWIENSYPDLEFSTLTEQQLDSVGLLLGEEIYLDIYFDNVDHLTTDKQLYLKHPSVTLKSFPFSQLHGQFTMDP
ncbi:hypothetical protein TVAG_359810 [Trichomonas vaginalis G3]|uniref:Uncharacterized protein n=1 Tax=Trichomonas vaginalis (strain ATCC PRA-98 / G3) TaxID=412133 RepID=A2DTA0_TRIV3|nr:hypothetical protein TVAGG3_0968160 [Trichomonas vaginalis G3]EAY16372.1 hypothetical protein TVAG_359810 [Trichomonas vaginalis G3]KAI5488400.1 hypothetical protein TVAGG3_0968160 [Trichomonas vaginalis G3]|eukprot:XP_001328595.1 hypothetical protein [Trichomonas vaginalis G3]